MSYTAVPAQPQPGDGWQAWGEAADTNLRQLITDVQALQSGGTVPDLTTIYEQAKA